DARRLAESLLASPGTVPASPVAESIARDSAGFPLFIQELARESLASDGSAPRAARAQPTLEQVIGARVDRLSTDARRLLDAIVTAGRPVRARVALSAAGIGSQDREVLAQLRAAGFVVDWDTPDRRRFDVAHDRIRQVVAERLSPDATRAAHE